MIDQLGEFYPEGVTLFKDMVKKHDIYIPKGICSNLDDSEFDTMINISLGLVPLWENALGKNWQKIITRDKLKSLYKKM